MLLPSINNSTMFDFEKLEVYPKATKAVAKVTM